MSDDENKPGLDCVPRSGYLQHLHRDNVMPREQAERMREYFDGLLQNAPKHFSVTKSDSVPDGAIILASQIDVIHIHDDWVIDWRKMANKTILIKVGGSTDDIPQE